MRKNKKENNTTFAAKTLGKYVSKIVTYFFNVFLTLLLIFVVTGSIMAASLAIYVKNYIDPNYDIEELKFDLNMTTSIYYQDQDASGNDVWIELEEDRIYGSENRVWVNYDQIPGNLVNAFVAIEDKRFFSHKGVDLKRTAGAILGFVSGNTSYGGSTITQQLIKNVSGEDDITIQRKIQEILRALNLESKKNKEEILEMYLNTIYLSQGCSGIQTAANEYFGKNVSDLTLVECAALAAIPQFPTKWDPRQNPEQNKERRDVILTEMCKQGYISQAERDEAIATQLVLTNEGDDGSTYKEVIHSYFVDALIEDVINDLQETLGIDRTMASHMLYSGGLKIYSSMNKSVQDSMEAVYEEPSNFPSVSDNGVQPESAMVVIDNKTGLISGLVGGRNIKETSRGLNRATQSKRQPGSSIKPLSVYSLALEEGLINFSSIWQDSSFMVLPSTHKPWPSNYPAGYQGGITINDAIKKSKNTIAVKVLNELTPEFSYKFLTEKFKLSTLVDGYEDSSGKSYSDIGLAQLGLGGLTYGVTVAEMAAAYATFPREGVFTEASTYTKVLDNQGNVILSNEDSGTMILTPETCDIMTKLLENVVDSGTAKNLTLKKSIEVAAKTGTTSSTKDLYFAGYTPYYTGVVWFGYDIARDLGRFKTSPALETWDNVMTLIHQKYIDEADANGTSVKTFEMNGDVVELKYCSVTGKLASSGCQYAETGYFTNDNKPKSYCKLRHSGEAEEPEEEAPAETQSETPVATKEETPKTEEKPVATKEETPKTEEKPAETKDTTPKTEEPTVTGDNPVTTGNTN